MNKDALEVLKLFSRLKKRFSTNKNTITISDYVLFMTVLENGILEKDTNQKMITASSLAYYLEMSKPALTKQTKRLEKAGYLEKITVPNNLRNRYIVLSSKAIELITDEHNEFTMAKEVVDVLGKDEANQLIYLLTKVDRIINNQ